MANVLLVVTPFSRCRASLAKNLLACFGTHSPAAFAVVNMLRRRCSKAAGNFTFDGVPVKIVQLENQKWEATVGASPQRSQRSTAKPGTDQIKKLIDLHKITRAVFTPVK